MHITNISTEIFRRARIYAQSKTSLFPGNSSTISQFLLNLLEEDFAEDLHEVFNMNYEFAWFFSFCQIFRQMADPP